jgi:hypothetical protein
MLGHRCLETLTSEERRAMWPPALSLEERHIRNCRLVADRVKMLDFMPKHGVCAELGIFRCEFSETILRAAEPIILHLVDISGESARLANEKFAREIASGSVQVHCGDSATVIATMPASYFDWVYVDGDHTYEGVRRDLAAVRPKLRPGGLIALNDYIYFGTSDFAKYGVIEAVNEFCITHDFELVFFALQGRMYNDVVIRQIE